MMNSEFSLIQPADPIEIYDLLKQHAEDKFEKKVNLILGAYRSDEGKPWVLPVVRKAEEAILSDKTLDKEYLPLFGIENVTKAANELLLGKNCPAILENRVFGIQTLSGTGALKVGAEFLNKILQKKVYYISNPSYSNHPNVFTKAGFETCKEYRYWNPASLSLDIEGFLDDLRKAPKGSVIILHACAHNPTGCDPSHEQWGMIADVMEEKGLFPFFDCAYQGLATGDLDRDAWAIRMFVQRGFEIICAQSFSKNFGLYSERVGNMAIVVKDKTVIPAIKSQLSIIVRSIHTSPPSHGARILNHIFTHPELITEWKDNLKSMTARISKMRKILKDELEKLGTPGDWSKITSQIGMFSYVGLSEKQNIEMIRKHHIYLLKSGRLTICGLTSKNVEYVARAIDDVVKNIK